MMRLLFRIFILLAALWCVGLVLFVFWTADKQPYEGKAEGAVVLTGGEGRIAAGLQLLREKRVEKLLISGVHPDVKVTELLAIHKQPAELADHIELGFSAQDTLGNADETAAWVQKNKLQSLIIVTAHYHMPRALIHLGEQLPDVALYPYPVLSASFRDKGWMRDAAARHLVLNDYNKFLLTYPQILLLRYAN